MEEGKGERYLASGRRYGNALLGVRHQEEEEDDGSPNLFKESFGDCWSRILHRLDAHP